MKIEKKLQENLTIKIYIKHEDRNIKHMQRKYPRIKLMKLWICIPWEWVDDDMDKTKQTKDDGGDENSDEPPQRRKIWSKGSVFRM